MGWDAYTKNIKPAARVDFELASERVIKEAGSVDGLLASGGLDVSNCAHQLELATGVDAWTTYGWSVDEVIERHENADWPKLTEDNREEWWSILSAKMFLCVCAERKIPIHFSY